MEKAALKTTEKLSTGDAAVTGLFGGLLGGIAMGAVIGISGLIAGQGWSYLTYFSAGTPGSPLQGFLMHLGVSSIYGILYMMLIRGIGHSRLGRTPGWLTGLIYAMMLWVFAVTILLPATDALILEVPWLVFFAGHAAYGLVLGSRKHL
jgi:hypothetical protein